MGSRHRVSGVQLGELDRTKTERLLCEEQVWLVQGVGRGHDSDHSAVLRSSVYRVVLAVGLVDRGASHHQGAFAGCAQSDVGRDHASPRHHRSCCAHHRLTGCEVQAVDVGDGDQITRLDHHVRLQRSDSDALRHCVLGGHIGRIRRGCQRTSAVCARA